MTKFCFVAFWPANDVALTFSPHRQLGCNVLLEILHQTRTNPKRKAIFFTFRPEKWERVDVPNRFASSSL